MNKKEKKSKERKLENKTNKATSILLRLNQWFADVRQTNWYKRKKFLKQTGWDRIPNSFVASAIVLRNEMLTIARVLTTIICHSECQQMKGPNTHQFLTFSCFHWRETNAVRVSNSIQFEFIFANQPLETCSQCRTPLPTYYYYYYYYVFIIIIQASLFPLP